MNMNNQIKWIILHHTGGTESDPYADTSYHTFEDINAWHRKDPNVWLGKLSSLGYSIGYTYFIDRTGKVTQGRSDTEQAAHCKGYNNNPWDSKDHSSIGICLAGNFDVTLPTKPQIESLKHLLKEKMSQYQISSDFVVPHRRFANKTCYGKYLADDWVRTLVYPSLPPDPCTSVKVELEEEKNKVSNLQIFINSLLNLFK